MIDSGFIHFRDPKTCLACRLDPDYPKVHTHPIVRAAPHQSFCCNPQMYNTDHAEGCEAHPQRETLQSDAPAYQIAAHLSRNEEADDA